MSDASTPLTVDEVIAELKSNPEKYHQNPAALSELRQRVNFFTDWGKA